MYGEVGEVPTRKELPPSIVKRILDFLRRPFVLPPFRLRVNMCEHLLILNIVRVYAEHQNIPKD